MGKMDVIMLIDDLAIEMLSRLSYKDLAKGKCISKRWYSVISSHDFFRARISRVNKLSALYIQCLYIVRQPILNVYRAQLADCEAKFGESLGFLPEKVIMMASSNGILCCRSFIVGRDNLDLACNRKRLHNGSLKAKINLKPNVYLCNPMTKEWVMVEAPKNYNTNNSIAMAFSISGVGSRVKLVAVLLSKKKKAYTYLVYSSETRKWRTSMEVCHTNSKINDAQRFVIGSKCYWLMSGHHMMVFDIEKEHSMLINLPAPVVQSNQMRFGKSEGYLHYVCVVDSGDMNVWMLQDCDKGEWLLKHCKSTVDILKEHGHTPRGSYFPVAFYDDEVFFYHCLNIIAYNFRTKIFTLQCSAQFYDGVAGLDSTFLPYTTTMASVKDLK